MKPVFTRHNRVFNGTLESDVMSDSYLLLSFVAFLCMKEKKGDLNLLALILVKTDNEDRQ